MMQMPTNWIKRTIVTTGISIAMGTAAAAGAKRKRLPPPKLRPQRPFGPANPFYAVSTLPFQAPPFDKIKDSDYQPAIDAGMVQQIA